MKRLVFCFDGTWNKLDSSCPTNVVITAESVLPLSADNTAQLIYYHNGVGTGRWDRIRGGMFGSGLVENLADAYRFLIFNYTPGDEIYIFGFSRGAYTARSFAGLLGTCGILMRSCAGKVKEAIERYKLRDDPAHIQTIMQFRQDNCPVVCVSDAEDEWRVRNVSGYTAGSSHRLRIAFLGVWDTVGALGIPSRFMWSSWINKKNQFHDTSLSNFVKSARHAVAIDERRKDFFPTLWDNIVQLNEDAQSRADAEDAPYQQKWFPGTHSSVGGGGDRRGLSDQAMDWVLDGARHVGLELDASRYSRIFELSPDYTEYLENSAKPSFLYRAMNELAAADRTPGPSELYEVSVFARRRWLESPARLKDGIAYRPATLSRVAKALGNLDPAAYGIGANAEPSINEAKYQLYQVKQGDTLRKIALAIYGDAKEFDRIFAANRDKLENPDRIYARQQLRIPLDEPSQSSTTS